MAKRVTKKKTAKKKSPPAAAPVKVAETPVVTEAPALPPAPRDEKLLAYLASELEDVKSKCADMAKHYGANTVSDEIMSKWFKEILDAPTYSDGAAAGKKAIDRFQLHMWAKWAEGKIPGPLTQHNAERKAKSADSLADYLEAQGNVEAAEKQRQRAEAIREEARKLMENK